MLAGMKRIMKHLLIGLALSGGVQRSFAPIPAGSLQVNLLPASAAAAGAKWQVDGGALQDSGATNFATGNHTLNFTTVHGWATPASFQVTIASAQFLVTNSIYTLTSAPAMAVTRTATNIVKISWPSAWTNWGLQQNSNVAAINWTASPATIMDDGTNKSFSVNPQSGSVFYRLKL